MKFQIKKATKHTARLRMALIGPSGSGKTYTALAVATELGKRVVVIDTERGSASKYADRFGFDVLELETFEPRTYVEALRACVEAGADVVVVDSLSHAWMGKGGALEQVDRAAKRQGGNSFGAWRDVTPQHNELVDAMLRTDAHLIVTMRSKTEYVQERDERTGRTVVRKVGLAPVQRDGLEYEFDLVGEVSHEHEVNVTKSRCPALADTVLTKPGADLAQTLRAWLTDGTPADAKQPAEGPAEEGEGETPEPFEQLREFYIRVAEIDLPGEAVAVWIKHRSELAAMPPADREAAWQKLCARTEEVGKMKNARVWLKKAIAEEDARCGRKTPHEMLLGEVRSSASVKQTAGDLAGLWRAVRTEIEAAKLIDDAWKIIADRALALKITPAAVRAEIDRLDRNDRGPQGPNGSRKPTPTGEAASAHGEGTDGGAANDSGPVNALRVVSDAAQAIIERHRTNLWGFRGALKKHRAELLPGDVPELAAVLARLDVDPLTGATLAPVAAEQAVRTLTGLARAA